MLAFVADISERRKAQERERQLEAQMLHAQKLESLGVLAGGIAHDFNNLLVGILGNAQLALRQDSPSSIEQNLQGIVQAAQRAADLCRQMLAYAGRGRLQLEAVDVSQLSLEILDLLRASISKRIHIACECAPDLPAVEADATQLRQLVMNLLTNASEALGDSDGEIRLRCGMCDYDPSQPQRGRWHEAPAAGHYVYVEVADTGCGMDAETHRRMFDPFFTSKQLGSGLGLAAALGIVRRLHGGVLVDSESNRGTTVRILLPPTPRAEAPSQHPDRVVPLTGRTILVVDDEALVRNVVRAALEHAGHRVLLAGDGLEALERHELEAGAIDAVLMDVSMPRMDGREASRQLRARDPQLPIVLASGFALDEANDGDAQAQPAFFIAKPYDLDSLLSVLHRALSQRNAGG